MLDRTISSVKSVHRRVDGTVEIQLVVKSSDLVAKLHESLDELTRRLGFQGTDVESRIRYVAARIYTLAHASAQ